MPCKGCGKGKKNNIDFKKYIFQKKTIIFINISDCKCTAEKCGDKCDCGPQCKCHCKEGHTHGETCH